MKRLIRSLVLAAGVIFVVAPDAMAQRTVCYRIMDLCTPYRCGAFPPPHRPNRNFRRDVCCQIIPGELFPQNCRTFASPNGCCNWLEEG